MRIVVAGATGFLGGHVIDELLRHDVETVAVVRPGVDASRLGALEVEVAEADALDLEALRSIVQGADFVVNAVRLTAPGLSAGAYDDVNIGGVTALLDACVDTGVQGFVHLSSATMYGDGLPAWPVDEGWALRPGDVLGQSRAMAERAARTYRRRVPLVVVRPALTFGAGDRGIMHAFLVHVLRERRARLVGGGKAPVSLAYAPDLARAVWGLVEHIASAVDGIFHMKSFDTDWVSVVEEAQRLTHAQRPLGNAPFRLALAAERLGLSDWVARPPRSIPRYVELTGRPHLIDDARLRSVTGFAPVYGLPAALRQTLESMQESHPWIRL